MLASVPVLASMAVALIERALHHEFNIDFGLAFTGRRHGQAARCR